jgi:hypothetical protein
MQQERRSQGLRPSCSLSRLDKTTKLQGVQSFPGLARVLQAAQNMPLACICAVPTPWTRLGGAGVICKVLGLEHLDRLTDLGAARLSFWYSIHVVSRRARTGTHTSFQRKMCFTALRDGQTKSGVCRMPFACHSRIRQRRLKGRILLVACVDQYAPFCRQEDNTWTLTTPQ